MQIVHTVTESSGVTGKLFNAAHVYSSLNRKMIAPVDNKGNAQLFALNIKVISAGDCTSTFSTASNSYVTKQSIKAWYKVWRQKLSDAGISLKDLGPYGRVFKPRLAASESLYGSSEEIGRGEWNYSDIVTTPAVGGGSDSVEANELHDQFSLSIIGSTAVEDHAGGDYDTIQYSNVGMIESWLGSRKKPLGADDNSLNDSVDEDLLFDSYNPLLLTRGGTTASGLMLEEVRDLQKDEPPYTEADFTGTYKQAMVQSSANLSAQCDIVAPCGLVNVTTSAAATVIFTLVGIADM